jgi:hypothetical protein
MERANYLASVQLPRRLCEALSTCLSLGCVHALFERPESGFENHRYRPESFRSIPQSSYLHYHCAARNEWKGFDILASAWQYCLPITSIKGPLWRVE